LNNPADEEEKEPRPKQKGFIRKYTGNGTLPLHEAIVINEQSSFLLLGNNYRPQYIPKIEISNKLLYPADTLDTQNPLPYIFNSTAELESYLELAKKESFESLHTKVKSTIIRYVNTEEHYIVILAADIIYSYFQDKFGTTHYNIFVGDNGSGKNSALLVFKFLGYRVFYITAASAPNYFTFLGEIEECQGTTAEDEAEDIGYDREKQKILKTGYCSGGTVPKVDLSNGRTQGAYLTYCHKWFAMESQPDYKKIKGIIDRSLVYNFVVGNVSYNIKDVIRSSGDQKYKHLYEELVHVRKLLFAFRLIHFNDCIPDIDLNIVHRNAELTKPMLRLFCYRNDSPEALEQIRLALSKFIETRNELKKNSLEARLWDAITSLVKKREETRDDSNSNEYAGLEDYSFYNDQIFAEVKDLTSGMDMPFNPGSFYSSDYGGQISHKFITRLYKSKFKADSFRIGSGSQTRRGLKFSKEVLDKLGTYYNVPNEIVIGNGSSGSSGKSSIQATDSNGTGSVKPGQDENPKSTTGGKPPFTLDSIATHATDPTHCGNGQALKENNSEHSDTSNNKNNSSKAQDFTESYNSPACQTILGGQTNDKECASTSSRSVASVASVATIGSNCRGYSKGNDDSATRLEKKIKEVGSPAIPCMFCSYADPIDFDLSLHYLEKHKTDLFNLPIGKGSMEARADYAIAITKRKLAEAVMQDEEETTTRGEMNAGL
jgi:hypothetical protein